MILINYTKIEDAFDFPIPLIKKDGVNFSFSGIKTHAAKIWNAHNIKDKYLQGKLAYSLQKSIVNSLSRQCKKALKSTNYKNLVIAGGVSANTCLRKSLHTLMTEFGGRACFPRHEYCTDNGAMIAYAGYLYYMAGIIDTDLSINVDRSKKLALALLVLILDISWRKLSQTFCIRFSVLFLISLITTVSY